MKKLLLIITLVVSFVSTSQIKIGQLRFDNSNVFIKGIHKPQINIFNDSTAVLNSLKLICTWGEENEKIVALEDLSVQSMTNVQVELPFEVECLIPGKSIPFEIECVSYNNHTITPIKTQFNFLVAKGSLSDKKVFIEMACAQTCSPCFLKIEEVRELYNNNLDDVVLAVYNQAPIGVGSWGQSNLPYNGFHDEFDVIYQSDKLVDRTTFPGNQDALTVNSFPNTEVVEDVSLAFNEQINMSYVPVGIDLDVDYDPTSRNVNVDATGLFSDYATGDIRFHILLVEDTVIGPDQNEDYAQWILSSSTANDYGYYSLGTATFGSSPIIFSYPFFQPCRVQPNGFYGNSGVISSSCSPGESYTENFNFTLPDFANPGDLVGIDPNRVEVIVAVVKYGPMGSREVLNVNKAKLTNAIASLDEEHNESNVIIEILGNPVQNNQLNIRHSSSQLKNGEWRIHNALGQMISSPKPAMLSNSVQTTTLDISTLGNGTYFLSFADSEGRKSYTRRFQIISK
ncbi:MAG: T9SS type A sorting domain-containing protein [Lishizhenia sp.]